VLLTEYVSSLLSSVVGLGLGIRHALEPDHLAAVSTLAAGDTASRASFKLGALWGLGHSLTLLVVGGSLAWFETQMPQSLALSFEVLVSVMIVSLGIRAVIRAVREGRSGSIQTHTHVHSGVLHTHSSPGRHLHLSRWTLATRPLLVGALHGLAGSGALTALVIFEMKSPAARVLYIVLFGLGSTLGMALMTGLAGVPLVRLAKSPRFSAGILFATGVASTAIGLWWGSTSVFSLLDL
jgi:high-affinity nickel permease